MDDQLAQLVGCDVFCKFLSQFDFHFRGHTSDGCDDSTSGVVRFDGFDYALIGIDGRCGSGPEFSADLLFVVFGQVRSDFRRWQLKLFR